MSRVRLAALAIAVTLVGLLVCPAVWAQPGQQPGLTQDQAQNANSTEADVSSFVEWLRKVDPVTADVLFDDPTRPIAAAAEEFCEGAIDPGGIFCALACECECNFGYLGSQCCCPLN